jgi:hypothetical protein
MDEKGQKEIVMGRKMNCSIRKGEIVKGVS